LSPIDGGYKSSEIEIVNLGMLTFAESPGDHRSFIIDILTRSLFGEFRFKICGYPSPSWLRAMIIKLYKQMTEIRVHADKDCWKYNCMRRISTATTVLTHRRVTDPLLTENPT